MLQLLHNKLYFGYVTSHWAEHTNKCYLCEENIDNRIHFLTCEVHKRLLNTLREEIDKINLVNSFPENLPHFFLNTNRLESSSECNFHVDITLPILSQVLVPAFVDL